MNNPENVKQVAYDLANMYEQKYGCCSQCVLGALTGGIMAISCFVGRDFDNMPDPDGVRFESFRLGRKLVERFEEEYGVNGGDCSAVQTKLMGRSYDILRGERDEFIANGGHSTICPVVCGNAAKWVVEILAEEGLI